MKTGIVSSGFFAVAFSLFAGGLSEDQLDKVKRGMDVASVSDKVERDEDRNKISVLKVFTSQDKDLEMDYRLRVVVELTDKSDEVYVVDRRVGQTRLNSEYTGEDAWEIRIPQGDLERPKITAYVVQYGILQDGKFIMLAERMDDADSAEEIKSRETATLDRKVRVRHQYSYRETDEESSEILWSYWQPAKEK